MVKYKTVEYNDLAKHEKDPRFGLNNIAQIMALKFKDSDQGIVVANTHLYYHPKWHYIRLLQCAYLLKELQSFEPKYPFIACGDFNTCPDNIPYIFLVKREESLKYLHDITNIYFEVEDKKAELEHRLKVVNELLQSNLPHLQSVYKDYQRLVPCTHKNCKLWDGEPPYTVYTTIFQGLLDYIFIEKETKLIPTKILEIPNEKELSKQTGIPNDKFSSDHVCIMCEFQL